MKVGQTFKVIIPSLRPSVGNGMGWCEVDVDVERKVRVVQNSDKTLRLQIVYNKWDLIYDYFLEEDSICLENLSPEEILQYTKEKHYDTYR